MALTTTELEARHIKVLESFVLRGRRVESHSLARDKQALHALASATHTVEFLPAEQKAYLVQTLPPEEQIESAAARVRPLILASEQTHYLRVLKALAYFARGDVELRRLVRGVRADWDKTRPDNPEYLGSYTQIQDADGNESLLTSDIELAYAYVYGDIVHHDEERLERTRMFGVANRFRVAAPIVGRLMFLTIALLNLTRKVHEAGLVALDERVFSDDVVVEHTTFRNETRVWQAPLGAPPPQSMGASFSAEWTEIVSRLPPRSESSSNSASDD